MVKIGQMFRKKNTVLNHVKPKNILLINPNWGWCKWLWLYLIIHHYSHPKIQQNGDLTDLPKISYGIGFASLVPSILTNKTA